MAIMQINKALLSMLFIISLAHSYQACLDITGIDSPINVLNLHIDLMLDSLSINNPKKEVKILEILSNSAQTKFKFLMKTVELTTLTTENYIGAETVYDGKQHEIIKLIQSKSKIDIISTMKIRTINEMNLNCNTIKEDFFNYFTAKSTAIDWFKQTSKEEEEMKPIQPKGNDSLEKMRKMTKLIESYDSEIKNVKNRFKISLASLEKINQQNEKIINGLRNTVEEQEKELDKLRLNYSQLLQKYIEKRIEGSEKKDDVNNQVETPIKIESEKLNTPFQKEMLNDSLFNKNNIIHSPFQINKLENRKIKKNNFKISPNTASDSSSRSRSLSEAEYYINNMPTSQRKLVEDYLLMRSLKNNTDPISINTLSIQQLMEIIVEVEQQYLSRSY